MSADRIGGIISVIFGSVAVSEAVRLYPMRTGPFVGDHVLPGVVGGALILLGLLLVFVIKGENFKAQFPERKITLSMLISIGLLFAYWFMIQYLGYIISTLLVAIGLFKVMGSIRIVRSVVYGALLTAVFYFIFIFWLQMPFPSGIFNL